jgi:protein involved in polysaccharide export with SLBB domain
MGYVSTARFKFSSRRIIGAAIALAVAGLQIGCTQEQFNTGTKIGFDYLNFRNSFLDPSQVGRFDKAQPFGEARFVQLPILEQLNIVDETVEHWNTAVDPTAADLVVEQKEYVFGVGDTINVSIFELIAPQSTYERTSQITETGAINIQSLGNIQVVGLTPTQLEEKLRQATIQAGILPAPAPGVPGPQVTVTLLASRQRIFSILGAVGNAGSFPIASNDFRLLDALAMARDIQVQPGMDYIYVIRQAPVTEKAAAPALNVPNAATKPVDPLKAIEDINRGTTQPPAIIPDLNPNPGLTPPAIPGLTPPETAPLKGSIGNPGANATPRNEPVKFSRELPREYREAAALAEKASRTVHLVDDLEAALGNTTAPSTTTASAATAPTQAAATTAAPTTTTQAPATATTVAATRDIDLEAAMSQPDTSQYGFVDGKLVVLPKKSATAPAGSIAVAPTATMPTPEQPTTDLGTGVDSIQTQRVIKIPIQALREGNSRYNIVVRPGDVINVPSAEVGEFYLMGHVNRAGVYTLTGRKVTLKQAIAAAGNLDGLAIPRRAEIIRRVGANQEVTVQVNLQAIFDGEQPDLFLKPNDILNVGTDIVAPFLAVTRNAYRASYGWGYVYDKNLSGDVTD